MKTQTWQHSIFSFDDGNQRLYIKDISFDHFEVFLSEAKNPKIISGKTCGLSGFLIILTLTLRGSALRDTKLIDWNVTHF